MYPIFFLTAGPFACASGSASYVTLPGSRRWIDKRLPRCRARKCCLWRSVQTGWKNVLNARIKLSQKKWHDNGFSCYDKRINCQTVSDSRWDYHRRSGLACGGVSFSQTASRDFSHFLCLPASFQPLKILHKEVSFVFVMI